MNLPLLSISRRTRATPWTELVTAAGVKSYTVYNHMLLPTVFRSVLEDYEHLRDHVQVWDVAVERQIELKGPDAFELLQLMTARDMTKMRDNQCFYVPIVGPDGKLMNDPVALKVASDTYWLSIASSDVALYAKGLVAGRGMAVQISEPDINPLAVQGAKADALMERVFGPEVHGIRFFRFARLTFQGVPLIVARSGFSGFGGFEIYTPGPTHDDGAHPSLAIDLWNALFEAGKDLNVGPGCPNWIDFTEAGLFSFGNTVGPEHTPFEARLGKYCDGLDTCIGGPALREQAEQGPDRMVQGVVFQGQEPLPTLHRDWPVRDKDGNTIGWIAGMAPSPALGAQIGVGTLARSHWAVGSEVVVHTPTGDRLARVSALPFRA